MPVTINGSGAISGLVITTADLADSSVTTAKIAAGAVATVDIADGAVTNAKFDASATAPNATNVTGTTTASIQTSALASGTANSTTFLRGDRTWATVSSTPTTADVLNATAGASVGAVGTYMLGRNATGGPTPGTTIAGSNLSYAATSGGSLVIPSGTWRCMGTTNGVTGEITVYLRIS